MKNFTIVFLLLTAVLSFAQYITSPPTDEPVKDMTGQYVLVTRQWKPGWNRSGDMVITEYEWIYDELYFDTLKDALTELQKDCGYGNSGYPCHKQNEFVGIYKLSLVVSRDQAHLSQGDKVQKHEVEQKDHWFKWEVESAK